MDARPTKAMSSGIRERTSWKATARVEVKPSPYRILLKESVIRRLVPVWARVVRASSAESSSCLKRLVSGTWVAVLMALLRGVGRGAGRGVGRGLGRGWDRVVVLHVLARDADDQCAGVDLRGEAGAVADEVPVDLARLHPAGANLDPPAPQQLQPAVGPVPAGQPPGDEDDPIGRRPWCDEGDVQRAVVGGRVGQQLQTPLQPADVAHENSADDGLARRVVVQTQSEVHAAVPQSADPADEIGPPADHGL